MPNNINKIVHQKLKLMFIDPVPTTLDQSGFLFLVFSTCSLFLPTIPDHPDI